MSAKPERDTSSLIEPIGDEADSLRSLVSAMLSGTYPEDVWLRDVTSQCHSKPEFGRSLLTLIERYRRLGQMPAAQYHRVRQKIEAALPAQPSAGRSDDRADSAANARRTARLPALPTEATLTAPLPIDSAKAQASPATASPRNPAPPPPRAAAAPTAAAAMATAAVPAPRAAAPAEPAAPAPAAPAPPLTPVPATNGAAAAATAEPAATPPPPRKASGTAPPPAARRRDTSAAAGGGEGAASPELVIEPGALLRERYQLESLLGSGGMAAVYKALDRYRARLGLPDCEVALKIVTPGSATPAANAALGREFHNAQQLSHPNIVNVFDIDHENGATFYTMELLEGEQLDELLGRLGGPLPLSRALAVIRDIAAAIEHAHSRGILHADLKPQNVFVTYGGQVRVLDFGGLSMPPTGHWIDEPPLSPAAERYQTATPAYASCEQLEGQQVDPRDDIYALACISYELLTGRHPFDGHTALQARAQHQHARRPPQLTLSSWRALRRALSFRRAQRPRELGPWLEQLGVGAAEVRLPPSYELRAARVRRHWGGWAALAASVLLCAGVTVTFIRQHPGPADWNAVLSSARSSLQQARDAVQKRLGQLTAPGVPATPTTQTASTAPAGHAGGAPAVAPTAAPSVAAAAAEPAKSKRSSGAAHSHRAPPPLLATAAAPGAATADTPPPAEAPASDPPTAAQTAQTAHTATAPTAAPAAPAGAGATADPAAAGTQGVEFSSTTYEVNDTSPAARVVVRRNGSNQDKLRFVWWTLDDTAKADVDYAPLGRRTEYLLPGQDHVTLYVPIISNPLRHETATFYVALGRPGATEGSPSARASVTIDRGG